MARTRLPATKPPSITEFTRLRGVDFTSNPGDVAEFRSPDCLNMVSDQNGRPVKRQGYKLMTRVAGRINGIYRLVVPDLDANGNYIGTKEAFLVHAGTKLYAWDPKAALAPVFSFDPKAFSFDPNTFTFNVDPYKDRNDLREVYSGAADVKSMAFQMEGYLWILDGKLFLRWGPDDPTKPNGAWSVKPVETIGYVPTTRIGASPDGGNGVSFEDRNMLSDKAINAFYSDGTSKVYQLNTGNITSVNKVEVMDSNGVFQTKATADYTVQAVAGTVTFATAPGKSPISGEDNVRITYTKPIKDGTAAAVDKINKCTCGIVWGVEGGNRLVLSGNPRYPNMDFTSEMSNPAVPGPTFFPELNYALVGSEAAKIIGYHRMDSQLAVLKEQNQQDATVFLRSFTYMTTNDYPEGRFTPTTIEGINGPGALTPHAMCSLKDDPLFLAADGVYALETSAITSTRYARGRSWFVDKKLEKEPGLKEAVAAEYDGYYHLAVNGHVYVADSLQKSTMERSEDFQYEWYYWDSLPVRVWFVYDGALWFGTDDGRICRFNLEKGMTAYNDNGQRAANADGEEYITGGEGIRAYWTTPELSFDTYSKYKTLKFIYTKITPYSRTSVTVYRKDKGAYKDIDHKTADVFDWWNIDFDRFTFNTDRDVGIIVTRAKKKKIITTQIRLENKEISEPFGITGMTLWYDLKNRAKRTR